MCLSVVLPLSCLPLFRFSPRHNFYSGSCFPIHLGVCEILPLRPCLSLRCPLYQLQVIIASIVPFLLMPSVSSGHPFSPALSVSHFRGVSLPFSLFLSVALFVHAAVSVLLPSRVVGQVCQRSVKNKLFATVQDSSTNSRESWFFFFNLEKNNINQHYKSVSLDVGTCNHIMETYLYYMRMSTQ